MLRAIKVLREKDDQLQSFWLSLIADHPSIYTLDEWTKRPHECGPLTCFDTCHHALKFLYANRHLLDRPDFGKAKIYKCEYKPSDDDRLWYPHLFNGEKPPLTTTGDFPLGTLMANEIMLTQEVL